jgi:hypothetical protein
MANNSSVKVDPKDNRSVREKFIAHDVVVVEQADPNVVRVVKNRFGSSGVNMGKEVFRSYLEDLKKQNAHLPEVKVWNLEYYEAISLLKGLASI